MTDTKFTPGPWRVTDAAGAGCYRIRTGPIGKNEYGMVIAETYLHGSSDEANANLIAAAPELYAALSEAKFQIEYLHEKFAETGSGNNMLAKIDAALAKARGEWFADDILKREG